jgi:tetratricopeptide (TPR) repeat protein
MDQAHGHPQRRLKARVAKGLVLLLGLSLFFVQRSFARSDDSGLLHQQVNKLYEEGKYQEAIPLAKKLLAIEKRVFGLDHPNTAASLDNLARLYEATGDYTRAEPLYQQALQILKKVLGEDHPDTAASLNNLALFYKITGDYAKAEPLYQQALQIWKKALGPEHSLVAAALHNLAGLYQAMGDYAKAEPLYQQALQIRKKVLGAGHLDTAGSLNDLAKLYEAKGDYARAELLYQQALQIRRKVLGEEHPDTATSLDNLAELYETMGDYPRAEPLHQQALQIRKKVLGEEHPDVAISLNNLALFYEKTGDYAKAEPLYEQALQIWKKTLGPEHWQVAAGLNNLAGLYGMMGDYGRAEPLYQQALQIRKKVLGLEHPDTATSLNNLAELYATMGAYEKAEPLYQQALQIEKKALGPYHPLTATSLDNLGELYEAMGAYEKAEPLHEQALQILKNALGEDHPKAAICLNNLALFYEKTGEYAKAEPLYQQALQIWKKALGPEHPNTAACLENLGLLKFELGQIRETKIFAQQSAQASLAILSKVLAFTSEPQRLAYQDTLHPYALFALLGGSEVDLASAVLRYKGVVLDSLLEDRLVAEASRSSQDRERLEQLAADKRQLGQLLLETPNKPLGDTDQAVENLEHDVELIEGQLARHVTALGQSRRALSVSVDQVQAVMPQDGALVEYLRYPHFLGKGKWEPRYGAVVLAATGPQWLNLGNANDVDAAVSRYQALVRSASDVGEFSESLESLYQQLWAPIERALPAGVKQVIISPDGQLNFVSFATLLDPEERFLAEKYTVQYVASGRDLLREVRPVTPTAAIVFANPDFVLPSSPAVAQADGAASSATAATTLGGTEKRGIEDLTFGSLEGTQKECDRLVDAFQAWRLQPEVFTRQDASEASVLKVHSPYILHLATHGFFEPEALLDMKSLEQPHVNLDRSVTSVTHSRFFQNPMHRSGLALASAQSTLEAWKRGEAPAVDNDGILTAEDVAALDLKGTWLVTLSACDTGSGEAKAGEGVLGLRRGFLQAGALHLLMTLWPISDETTVQIMTDFYDAARKTDNPPQALAQVQRAWLVKIRKERGLPQAVRLAGPFVMSSQGKP